MTTGTFGDRLMEFYQSLDGFKWANEQVALLSPIANESRHAAMAQFCAKYYGDNNKRIFWLGINPSRVRKTSTGVPYTDGFALETHCGIPNDFDKARELTSDFFYKFIEKFGGSKRFYDRHFAGAAFPLSVLRKDKYCNYYDHDLPDDIRNSVPDMVKRQSELGNAAVLVIIGTSENYKALKSLNDQINLFKKVFVVEHPRYIMQYKSKELADYIAKYCSIASEAEAVAKF